MKSTTSPSRLRRALSAGLGVALLTGGFLAAASPAQAITLDDDLDGLYEVSGTVSLVDAAGTPSTVEGLEVTLYPPYDEAVTENTAADGTFAFADLGDGDYFLQVLDPQSEQDAYVSVEFTIDGADVALDPIALLSGTAELSGEPVVGETLEISADGWPTGTDLEYGWGYSGGQSGGPIDGASGDTYTIEKDYIGTMIVAIVTGTLPGYEPMSVRVSTDFVTTPKKAAAPAPVADSDDLGSFLVSKGSTPEPQESVGLPAGSLSPSKDYEATVNWWSADSYVDVYLYSTPVFVGTFPVVNGVVQITLSADVLSELGAGGHTLVVLGQSSGNVSSVEISLSAQLASTGVDAFGALGAAGLLVLLGGAALLVARRARAKA
jgi:hypothetical protein